MKVLGTPRLLTSPGTEARLFAGPKGSGSSAGAVHGDAGGVGLAGGAGFAGSSTTTTITEGGGAGLDASPGLGLSVLPALTPDGAGFDLQLTAELNQWADRSPQHDGSQKEGLTTQVQAKARLTVPAGQTVILAKEVPNEGWTESDNAVPGPKSLLVFLTPSVVHTVDRLTNITKVSGGAGNVPSAPTAK